LALARRGGNDEPIDGEERAELSAQGVAPMLIIGLIQLAN